MISVVTPYTVGKRFLIPLSMDLGALAPLTCATPVPTRALAKTLTSSTLSSLFIIIIIMQRISSLLPNMFRFTYQCYWSNKCPHHATNRVAGDIKLCNEHYAEFEALEYAVFFPTS